MKKFVAVLVMPSYDTLEEAVQAAESMLKAKTLENQVYVAEIKKVARRCTDITIEDV